MGVEPVRRYAYSEMLRYFGDLKGLPLVVAGGQAVNFWAVSYWDRVPKLHELGPFASKDLDFIGDEKLVEDIHARVGGRIVRPKQRSPLSLIARVILPGDDGEFPIDVMRDLRGVGSQEISDHKVLVSFHIGEVESIEVHFIDPLISMKSRAHNVIEIAEKYDNLIGVNQLVASVLCAQEYVIQLLDSADDKAGLRKALNALEWIFRFCMDDGCARAIYQSKGIDPSRALVLSHPKLPANFLEHRWPRMKAELDTR